MSEQSQDSCVSIVQITDCHLQPQPSDRYRGCYPDARLDRVIQNIRQINVREGRFDHLVLSGDIAQSGAQQAYQRVLDKTLDIALQRHWIPGNHDDKQCMSAYAAMQQKVVLESAWAMVLLDSTSHPDGVGSGSLSASELDFLSTIDQLDAKHILLFMHHPPIEVGSLWQDEIKLANSDVFWQQLKTLNKVRAISFGHLHQELHLIKQGIELFCTPATAPQFKARQNKPEIEDDVELAKAAFRILNLHSDGSITTQVIRVD